MGTTGRLAYTRGEPSAGPRLIVPRPGSLVRGKATRGLVEGKESAVRRWLSHVYYWGRLWIANAAGHVPSHLFRRAIYRGLLKHDVSSRAVIYANCRFFGIGGLRVERGAIVGRGAFLDARRGIVIGHDTNLSSDVSIWTAEHSVTDPDFAVTGAPVTIGHHVYIGSRVTILPGVAVGDGAVVGAGAVVTRDVPPWTIVYGVPAKPAGERPRVRYRLDGGRPAYFQ